MVGYRSASGGQGHGLVQQGAAGQAADADLGRAAGVLGVERLVGLDLHADFRGQVAVHRRGVDDAAAAVDAVAGDLEVHPGARRQLGGVAVGEARLDAGHAVARREGEDHLALVGVLPVGYQLLDHAAVAGAGQGPFHLVAEELLDVARVELLLGQVALEHVQQVGREGSDRRAFGDFRVGPEKALHGALAGHGDLLVGDADHAGIGMGDEVQVVHLVEDEGEGADPDDEDRGAQGHRPDPAEEAHPAVAAALLAGLGEVLALEGIEHVADADHLAGQVGGDQVAQGRHLARLEVLELAADAAAGGVHRAHLELHFEGKADAVDLEQQLALVQVAGLDRRAARGEGEAAGGEIQQACVDAFAVGADVADARRQLDPGELALGFGFVHDVDVDGCIHGVGSCSVQSGSICARAAALALSVVDSVVIRWSAARRRRCWRQRRSWPATTRR